MFKKEEPLAHLVLVLKDIVSWFREEKVSGMIIGGVAAAILGRPRVTRDVDAVVLLEPDFWSSFLNSGEHYGFKPRVKEALEFAKKRRVLLLFHVPSQIQVDISFGALSFEKEAISKAESVRIDDLEILLPRPEDLIIMKAVAHRDRDLIDIQSIVDANPKVNIKRIRKWVKEFAKVLEMPEIFEDLQKLLKKRK